MIPITIITKVFLRFLLKLFFCLLCVSACVSENVCEKHSYGQIIKCLLFLGFAFFLVVLDKVITIHKVRQDWQHHGGFFKS